MLDVNRLRVIEAVARHESVTAAAKELNYSQPSVTHHLGRLEAETGAQLLQRVGRGIRVTPAGRLLADRAAEILGRIDAADSELAAHVGLTAGRVRLGAFASASAQLVPGRGRGAGGHPPGAAGQRDRHAPTRRDRAAAHRRDRGGDHLPLRRGRARTGRGAPAPPARRPGLPALDTRPRQGWSPCATRRGSPAASAAAATCCPSAPSRVRAADRLPLRRHGRHGRAGGRRHGRGHPDRAGATRPSHSRASWPPSCPARNATSSPRPTASHRTRRRPRPFSRPWRRPPRPPRPRTPGADPRPRTWRWAGSGAPRASAPGCAPTSRPRAPRRTAA